ncbi:hypothetical protein NQ663_22220, partial [Acinetobacter baumannii]|nr:hypothetical protein [Acinetobacter baumannii]
SKPSNFSSPYDFKSNPPYASGTIITLILVVTSGYNFNSISYPPATFIVSITIFFLSIDKLNFFFINVATSLLVIAPNNLPFSPPLAFIITSFPFNSAAYF